MSSEVRDGNQMPVETASNLGKMRFPAEQFVDLGLATCDLC